MTVMNRWWHDNSDDHDYDNDDNGDDYDDRPPFSGLQVLQPERYRSPATKCTLKRWFDNIDNTKNLPLEKESVLLSDD